MLIVSDEMLLGPMLAFEARFAATANEQPFAEAVRAAVAGAIEQERDTARARLAEREAQIGRLQQAFRFIDRQTEGEGIEPSVELYWRVLGQAFEMIQRDLDPILSSNLV